jgi:ribosomal protein S18 acetylase RimI-like enzyme
MRPNLWQSVGIVVELVLIRLPQNEFESCMTYEIRRLGRADAALFGKIAEGVFDEPVDPALLAAYLGEPGHLMVLALADGLVVGQCAAVLHRHPDKRAELYIDEVGVADAWLRRGIARAMLTRMLDIGRDLGCAEAWLGTETDNFPARGLYETCGGAGEEIVCYLFKL